MDVAHNHSSIVKRKRKAVERFIREQNRTSFTFPIFAGLISEALYEDLPDVLDRKKAKDFLLFIAGNIVIKNHACWFHFDRELEPQAFNARRLSLIFGGDYSRYMDHFCRHDIIFRVNSHIQGVRARRYIINGSYWNDEIVYREISTPAVRAHITEWRNEQLEETLSRVLQCYNALFWYTTGCLKFDDTAARSFAEKMKDREFFRGVFSNVDYDVEKVMKHLHGTIPTRFHRNIHSCDQLFMQNFRISIDKGHRIYAPATLISRPLRFFLNYDGRELAMVDISNSQPYHLSAFLDVKFWNSQKQKIALVSLYTELYEYFNEERRAELKEVRSILRSNPPDVALYKSLVSSGTFYTWLHENLQEFGQHFHADRNASKKRFMSFLNEKVQVLERFPDYRAFRELFPTVCRVMEFIKWRHHTDMSRTLFRLEALMLTEIFCNEFGKVFPDVPVFTVHDSFIVPKDHVEDATEIARDTYSEYFDHPVPLKPAEFLEPGNARLMLDSYLDEKTIAELRTGSVDMPAMERFISRTNR